LKKKDQKTFVPLLLQPDHSVTDGRVAANEKEGLAFTSSFLKVSK